MNYYDNHGTLVMWDTFDYECPDCIQTIHVVDGQSDPHDCPVPEELRGRVGKAWAEGERWVLDHPEDYGLVVA